MAFWDKHNFEPKRAFRWKVEVLSFTDVEGEMTDSHVSSFLAKKVTKPSITIQEAEHKHLNKSYYFPGHVTWDPVTVTVVDTNDGEVVRSIAGALRHAGYDFMDNGAINKGINTNSAQGDAARTLGKANMVDGTGTHAQKRVRITQLDSEGFPVETILLHNAWIKSFKPSELSYDTEDLSTYDIELRYDWASFAVGEEAGKVI